MKHGRGSHGAAQTGTVVSICVALVLSVVAVPAVAEVYAYQTPGGVRVFSDRVLSKPGYSPANYAARRGVRPYRGRVLIARPVRYAPGGKRISVAQQEIDRLIDRNAPEFDLDPALVRHVVQTESGYRADAVSPKNAQGLMQLIPATARRFGVRDSFDAEQNLRGGMAYLRFLMGQFRGDLRLALAGYNAGEGAVLRHKGVPPYAETQAYVSRIVGRYGSATMRVPAAAPDPATDDKRLISRGRVITGTGPAAR